MESVSCGFDLSIWICSFDGRCWCSNLRYIKITYLSKQFQVILFFSSEQGTSILSGWTKLIVWNFIYLSLERNSAPVWTKLLKMNTCKQLRKNLYTQGNTSTCFQFACQFCPRADLLPSKHVLEYTTPFWWWKPKDINIKVWRSFNGGIMEWHY